MKQVKKIILVILFLLISFHEGCIPSKPTEEAEILSSERLINKLEANRRRIRTFEGSGTIIVRNSDLKNSALFQIILQKPDTIFLTIFGPFGIELAQSLITKNDFVFYDALQNTAYEGKVDSDILRDIFKIDLSFNDLIDAFIGAVNLTENLYKPPSSYDVIYDKYLITYTDSITNKSAEYKVDVRELGITDYILKDGSGKINLEGKYSDFGIIEGVAIPYKIELRNPSENQNILVEYKSISANKKNILVNFKIPQDATIIKW